METEVGQKVMSILNDTLAVQKLYENAVKLNEALQDMNDDLSMSNREVIDENDSLKEKVVLLENLRDLNHATMARLEKEKTQLERSKLDAATLEAASQEWMEESRRWRKAFDIAVVKLIQAFATEHLKQAARHDLVDRLREAGVDVEIPGEVIGSVDDEALTAPALRCKVLQLGWELERYKAASLATWSVLRDLENEAQLFTIATAFKNLMLKEGYDIETEEHRIEGFGSSGSEDNPEGKDEHDFL